MNYQEISAFFKTILIHTQNGQINSFSELLEVIKKEKALNKNKREWILQYPAFISDALFDIGDEKQLSLITSYMNRKNILNIFTEESKMSEYYYIHGNILFNRAQLLYNTAPNKIEFLASDVLFINAIKEFSKVEKNYECSFYIRALININAILEVFGRSYEVLYRDGQLLKEFPYFGPIHANKAISLLNYWNILPQDKRHENIMHEANFSLTLALRDMINTTDYLGIKNYNKLKKEKGNVEDFINHHKVTNSFSIISKEPYYDFCLTNNLMLNFHFSNEARHPDDLKDYDFLSLTDVKFKNHIRFNELQLQSKEIIEDFITCRYLFYKYSMSNEEVSEISKFSGKMDILSHGILKTIFVKLYNILDKIAKVILIYTIPNYSKDTYFKNLLEEEFKNILVTTKSKYFMGLYSLCRDFEENNIYYDIRAIRNKLVHEYISIENNIISECKQITLLDIQEKLLLLFQCVKGAHINMCFGIKSL